MLQTSITRSCYVPYSSINLTESSPVQSFEEPLSVAELIEYLRLPENTDEVETIQAMILAAREQAEILQGRDLVRKQWDLSLDYWPSGPIELRGPVSSVDLLRYRDSGGAYTSMTENTDYIVDTAKQPAIVVPGYNTAWPMFTPWPSSAILVRYTGGLAADSAWWSDAGARVKIGMKLLISGWFNSRIPWAIGAGGRSEFPFAVTQCLSQGSVTRAR